MTGDGSGPGDTREPTGAGSDRAPAGLDRAYTRQHRPVRAAVAGAGLAVLAMLGVVTALVGVGPARIDQALLGESLQARSYPLTALAVGITEVGSTLAMAVLAGLVGLWLFRRGRRSDAAFVVGTMAGASVLFSSIKRLLDRPRPPEVDRLVAVSNESLPSGHATMAVVVLGSLIVLAWPGRSRSARLGMVAAAAGWAVAVGLTRIYLGVHWFSDVLAGWLVGGAWLAACTAVLFWYRARRGQPVSG